MAIHMELMRSWGSAACRQSSRNLHRLFLIAARATLPTTAADLCSRTPIWSFHFRVSSSAWKPSIIAWIFVFVEIHLPKKAYSMAVIRPGSSDRPCDPSGTCGGSSVRHCLDTATRLVVSPGFIYLLRKTRYHYDLRFHNVYPETTFPPRRKQFKPTGTLLLELGS